MTYPKRSAGPADPGPRHLWRIAAAFTLIPAGVVLAGGQLMSSASAEETPTPTSVTVRPGGCGETAGGLTPFVRVRATHPGDFTLVVQGESVGKFTYLVDSGFPVTPGAVRVDLLAEQGSGASGSTTVAACETPGTSTPTPIRTPTVTPSQTPVVTPTGPTRTPGPTPTAGTTATPTQQATSTPSAAPSTPTTSTDAGAERSGGLASTGK